ncbi:MAG: DUF167 domain-containing protein [Patescibacteria group bacterium]|jgi:hypothetical protein
MQLLIEVKPNSKQEAVEKITDSVYKIRVRAPAREGRANEAVIRILADHFKVAKSLIRIKTGKTSRTKVVTVG